VPGTRGAHRGQQDGGPVQPIPERAPAQEPVEERPGRRRLVVRQQQERPPDHRDRVELRLREQRPGLVVTALVGLALAAVVRRQLRTLSASYRRAMEAERRGKEELERQVDERTAQLRDAVSQLEAFGYTISHDLRAPLRAMQGFSQALVEDYAEQLDPTARQYVGRIAAAAERMDEMILDLLAYSRVSRSELSLGPVDLGAVIAEAMGRVAAEVNHRGAAVGLDGPFPPVLGHAATLVQVVANLLTNAVKFVPPGVRPDWG